MTCLAPPYCHNYLRALGVDETVPDDLAALKKHVSEQHELYDVVINTTGLIGTYRSSTYERTSAG